jgi:hypothetical protein
MAERQPISPIDECGPEADKGVSLSFKVSSDFRKKFKGFAVAQGISMTDLLKEGFALSQKKRQQ